MTGELTEIEVEQMKEVFSAADVSREFHHGVQPSASQGCTHVPQPDPDETSMLNHSMR